MTRRLRSGDGGLTYNERWDKTDKMCVVDDGFSGGDLKGKPNSVSNLFIVPIIVVIGLTIGFLNNCARDCQDSDKKPLTKEESAKVIEAAIRESINKPESELTKADLEKVTELDLENNQLTSVKDLEKLTQLTSLNLTNNKLTDVRGLEKLTQLTGLGLNHNQLTSVKGLEKLTQLTKLNLDFNPDLTKAQIAELQKALPKCKISHDAEK